MRNPRQRPQCGLFAFSADPYTHGHGEVIERAASQCDRLIVAVMDNPGKAGKYLFTRDERLKIAKKAIDRLGLGNVTVVTHGSLLPDLYLREGCDRLYRGIRNGTDLGYEEDLIADLNRILPGIEDETEMVMPGHRFGHISSSTVKAWAGYNLDLTGSVPTFVKAELERRMSGQVRIGVTGGIATGKTTVATALAAELGGHLVNVDELVRALYREDSRGAQRVRDGIEKILGRGVLMRGRRDVNRSVMAQRFFDPATSEKTRQALTRLTSPHVDRLYREALDGKKGVIVVEWAQMAEMAMSHWVSHRVIVVDSPDRARFAKQRGIPAKQLARVRAKQWTADRKAKALKAAVKKADYGWVLRWENRWRDSAAARTADAARLGRLVQRRIGKPNF